MRLKPVTWKAIWAVVAVIVVACSMLVVPRATAQEAGADTTSAATEQQQEESTTEEPESDATDSDTTGANEPGAGAKTPSEERDGAEDAATPPAELVEQPAPEAEKVIQFGEVRVTNGSNKDPNATLKQWQLGVFEVDWMAPNGVTEGQKFSIVYPETFTLYNSEVFPLLDEGGVKGGECTVSQGDRSITCILNGAFVNRDDVHGTLRTELQATKALESREVTLNLNGQAKVAFLPGNGVGVEGVVDKFPKEPRKWGWYSSVGNTATWTINIPGENLVNAPATLHVKDSLHGYGHKFNSKPKIYEYEAVDEDGEPTLPEANKRTALSGNAMNVQHSGNTIDFDVEPPNPEKQWRTDRFYRIIYTTETHDGKLAPVQPDNVKPNDPGAEKYFTWNEVSVTGVSKFNVATISRKQRSLGTITGVKRGSYEVTKKVTGVDGTLIPADAMFKVKAEVFGADGNKLATEEISMPANGTQSGPKEWKAGTVVVLSEIDFPQVPGIEFTDYQFKPGEGTKKEDVELLNGGKSIKLKVVSNANVKVELENIAAELDTDAPFALVKNTAGVDSAKDKEFWFNYTCRVPGSDIVATGTMSILGNGEAKLSKERFPIGAICDIEEDVSKAGIEGYDLVAHPVDFKRRVDITAEPNVVKAEFTNTYVRMTGSLAVTKKIDNERVDAVMRDEEFKFEASWDNNGKTEKREFTLRPRDAYSDFPKLPLGTKVTIKEILPERTPWATPVFEGNVPDAVQDNGDGSATVTVMADDAKLLVTVTNSLEDPDNPPLGWLGLLAFIPFLSGGSSGSSGSSSNSTQTTAPSKPSEAPKAENGAQNTATNNATNAGPRQLAQTGASVIGIAVFALAIAGVGLFLVRRSRRNS